MSEAIRCWLGGLTSKIHVLVDGSSMPLRLRLIASHTHDRQVVPSFHKGRLLCAVMLADKAFHAYWSIAVPQRFRASALGRGPFFP